MSDDDRDKRPLPPPIPPPLVAKLDRLAVLKAEVKRLDQEIQEEYIELHRQDPTRFQRVQEYVKSRKASEGPRQQRDPSQRRSRSKYLDEVEGGDK